MLLLYAITSPLVTSLLQSAFFFRFGTTVICLGSSYFQPGDGCASYGDTVGSSALVARFIRQPPSFSRQLPWLARYEIVFSSVVILQLPHLCALFRPIVVIKAFLAVEFVLAIDSGKAPVARMLEIASTTRLDERHPFLANPLLYLYIVYLFKTHLLYEIVH